MTIPNHGLLLQGMAIENAPVCASNPYFRGNREVRIPPSLDRTDRVGAAIERQFAAWSGIASWSVLLFGRFWRD